MKQETPEEKHARMLERAAQYLICQVRGHAKSGAVTASIPPQNICKHCGTYFWWTEPKLVEGMGKPTEEMLAEVRGFSSYPRPK